MLKIILEQTTIKNILFLGKAFSGVFTSVIRLDIIKKIPLSNSLFTITDAHNKVRYSTITQQIILDTNNKHIFTFPLTDDFQLINKIYTIPHQTLKSNADWGLGIVTGNNKKFITSISSNLSKSIITGTDISSYRIKTPLCKNILFITGQQIANMRFYYCSEKLVYKFISKKLIFAYDNQQRLTLNSANILIPKIPGVSIKVILAFLNSKLFQYIFTKKFTTIKILRGDLEQLPFPLLDQQTHDQLESLVDLFLLSTNDFTITDTIDQLIFDIFKLTSSEQLIISSNN